MMPIKCIAIDDEPLALELIKQYVARIEDLQLLQTFDDAISGSEFLRQQKVDLLFIDINMPDITGVELVRSLTEKPMVIFTTAYKKFAMDGFDLDAIDYLLKPIDFERFHKAANKAIEYFTFRQVSKAEAPTSIFVRSEYKMLQIFLDDIDYIEGLEDYIKIHLSSGRPILTLMTLKAMLDKLPADRFKRIHRSYIVPVSKIKSIVNKKALMVYSKELPISDSYLSIIQDWMTR